MSVSRSLVYSISGAAVGFVTLLGSSMIVSRILTPAEMGVFTIAMGLVTVLITLRVFGVSAYLVQAQSLTDDIIRSVLFLSIIVCWSIGLLVAAAGGAASAFYDEPLIQPIFLILALDFVIFPFRLVTLALLQRRMAFREVFFIDLVASVVTGSLTVGLVMMDAGVIALAIGRTAGAFAGMLMCLLVARKEFYVRPRLKVERRVLTFGGLVVLSNFVAQSRLAVAPLFLGKALGPAGAAQYEKGDSPSQIIWTMVLPSVSGVLLPHFSRGVREGGQETERFIISANMTAAVFWPGFAALALLAPSVILLLFGWQWVPAGPVGSALAVASFILVPTSFVSPLFLALGRPGYNLMTFGTDLITRIAALLVAIPYGLNAIGVALIVPAIFYTVAALSLLHRHLGTDMRDYFAALRAPFLVTLVTLTGPLAVVGVFGYQTEAFLASVLWGGAATLLMWLVGVKLLMPQLLTAFAAAFQAAKPVPKEPTEINPV
ncbi:MAG: oligosaccharide flippase family protein [Alphaproteobacteria bacterium]